MANEHRKYAKAISLKYPKDTGKKNITLKLFKASKWRAKHHLLGKTFYPKVPLQTQARNEYFLNRFRLMVDGKWYTTGGYKYVMLTKTEAYQVLDEMEID